LILYVEYSREIEKELLNVMRKFPRFSEVVFYNFAAKFANYIKNESFNYDANTLEDILINSSVESIEDFILNLDVYNESLQYNFMLNKSVHINKAGEMKNFYNDLKIYGRLGVDEFQKVVANDDFKLIWQITKDQIEICKDCQFRYICPDKRIPFKDNISDKYYKHKINCKFNPYENSWKV